MLITIAIVVALSLLYSINSDDKPDVKKEPVKVKQVKVIKALILILSLVSTAFTL
jgi:formate hydrogenlyase subunit 3/multisubunit Na+/H+ antiporter MnhD subunit